MLLVDGFPTIISLVNGTTMKEISVDPPGYQGGGGIDTTTMRNLKMKTKAPKHLIEMTEMATRVMYDSVQFDSMLDVVNVNSLITLTLPDDSTVAFWGFVDVFDPDEATEGERMEADLTIIPTCMNNSSVEVDPVYTAPAPLEEEEDLLDEDEEEETRTMRSRPRKKLKREIPQHVSEATRRFEKTGSARQRRKAKVR